MNYNELNKADNKQVTLFRSFIHIQPVLMLTSHKTKHIPWCLALKKKLECERKLKRGGVLRERSYLTRRLNTSRFIKDLRLK